MRWLLAAMKVSTSSIDADADDPKLAYPLYEKCLELGVTSVQFHKGQPFGRQRLEFLMPNDLQRAGAELGDGGGGDIA